MQGFIINSLDLFKLELTFRVIFKLSLNGSKMGGLKA